MSFFVVLQFTWQQQCIGPPDMCTYTGNLLLLVNVVTFFFLISVQRMSTVHSTVQYWVFLRWISVEQYQYYPSNLLALTSTDALDVFH